MSKKAAGVGRLFLALRHSGNGLRLAFREEAAFRLEVCLAVVLFGVACWLDVGIWQRAALIAVLLLVLVVELLNTALEAAVDLISPQEHALAGKAKDAASAAVLLALLLAVGVWLAVLFSA